MVEDVVIGEIVLQPRRLAEEVGGGVGSWQKKGQYCKRLDPVPD